MRALARPGVRRERIVKDPHRPRLVLLQHALNDPGDARKVQPPAKKRGHRDFVRGIQDGRRRAPGSGRFLRQCQAWKSF